MKHLVPVKYALLDFAKQSLDPIGCQVCFLNNSLYALLFILAIVLPMHVNVFKESS